MIVVNESDYSTAEVTEALQQFHKSNNDVYCIVKNSKAAYAGTAYKTAPKRMSHKKCKYTISVRIGKSECFPQTNLITRYGPVVAVEYDEALKRYEVREKRKVPYGGSKSPQMEYLDWKEAIVATTAHELRHVESFRTGIKSHEHMCETYAAEQLENYRSLHDIL